MKLWRRALRAQRCGGLCGHLIAKGDVFLELHIPGLERQLRRCATCAGEPVPDVLPEMPSPPREPLTMYRFSADMLPLDYKRAASEPGADDAA
jgi:hypothetical protein